MIVHMIGNARFRPIEGETGQPAIDQAIATFRAAADRCAESPDYRFSNGDIWAYEAVERYDPTLFKRIVKRIRKRQWSVINGCFTLPDPDTQTYAGWVKQFEIGIGYCREKLGVVPKVFFHPELRSLPAFVPDLLARFHFQGMFIYLPDWPESLPSPLFRWKGPEGGEILCSRIHPNHLTRSDDLYGHLMEAVENGSLMLGHVPCPYGLGPWGGGPTKANIEYLRQHKDAFRDVLLKFSSYEEFMSEAFLMSDSFPVVEGRIGRVGRDKPACGSLKSRRKQLRAEVLAMHTEVIPGMITDKGRKNEAALKNESIWKDLLMAESSFLDEGTRGCEPALERLRSRAETNAMELIQQGILDWMVHRNTQSHHQQILIEDLAGRIGKANESWVEAVAHLDGDCWGSRMLCDLGGKQYPVQLIADEPGAVRLLTKVPVDVSGRFEGLIRIPGTMDEPVANAKKDSGVFSLSANSISNGLVKATSKKEGLLDLSDGEAKGTRSNTIEITFSVDGAQGADPEAGWSWKPWQLVEEGSLRAVWQAVGSFDNSKLVVRVEIHEGENRVKLHLTVDWNQLDSALDLVVKGANAQENSLSCGLAKGESRIRADGQWHPFQNWLRLETPERVWALVSPDLLEGKIRKDDLYLRIADECLRDGTGGCLEGVGSGFHKVAMEWIPGQKLEGQQLTRLAWSLIMKPSVAFSYEGMQRPVWGNRPPPHLWTENEKRAIRDGQMRHLSSAPAST